MLCIVTHQLHDVAKFFNRFPEHYLIDFVIDGQITDRIQHFLRHAFPKYGLRPDTSTHVSGYEAAKDFHMNVANTISDYLTHYEPMVTCEEVHGEIRIITQGFDKGCEYTLLNTTIKF